MKSIIRLPGLIAFVVIVGLVAATALIWIEPFVKSMIIDAAEDAAGAKVEIEELDLSLSPASITIKNMTVADAANPMQNAFEFKEATVSFELFKAMLGQFIINDVAVEGLEFSTARTTSGALPKKTKKEKAQDEEPSFVDEQLADIKQDMPSTDEIIAREPLLIDQRKAELEALLEEKQKAWDDIQARLPTAEKLASYQERLKQLLADDIKSIEDFNARKKALKQLKAEIKADKEAVQEAQTLYQEGSKALKAQIALLKSAPKEDIERIKSKYSFDEQGVMNMSALIFGPEVNGYIQEALYWYEKFEPLLGGDESEEEVKKERMEGRFVQFPEDNPLPGFLIKHVGISAILPAGGLDIRLTDVTDEQEIIGKPTRLVVSSTALEGMESLLVDAKLDFRSGDAVTTADFKVVNAQIDDFRVAGGGKLPVVLQQAVMQLSGQAVLKSGVLDAQAHGDFQDASFEAKAGGGLAGELAEALQTINTFTMDATAQGKLKKLDIDISSDIDKRLKQAMTDKLDAKQDELKQELEAKLQARVQDSLASVDLDGYMNQGDSLNDTLSSLDDMLGAKLDDYVEQQKKKKKKEAEEQLRQQLEGLF